MPPEYDTILSDESVLSQLGARIARHRLNLNKTQDEVAHEAGVARRSISKLENGHVVDTRVLVRVLRALNLLTGLEALAPPPEPSPLALAEAQGRIRTRASGRRKTETHPDHSEPGAWQWPDETN